MSRLIQRRQWCREVVCSTALVIGSQLRNPLALSYDPPARLGGSHLRTSVNAYSFLEMLNANAKDPSTGISLLGVCEFAAKINLDAVDLTGYFFPGYPNRPEDRFIAAIKRRTVELGLEISGTGVRNDFTTADKTVRAEGIARVKTWIEVASHLGAPVVRVFADCQAPFKTWQEASGQAERQTVEAWMADALVECAEYGAKWGVFVAVQNHGDFIRSGDDHLSLLRRVNHPWCAALVDTGKYVTADPYADIALVAPYAVNWQIKESLGSTLESPRPDLKRLVTIIRQSGYRGYIPLETLSMKRKDYNPMIEVPKLLQELRVALKETEGVGSKG